jgi:hypothetical protein
LRQDRDGALLVLAKIIQRFPWLRHDFADGGYAGDKPRQALRRNAKGFEQTIASATAWLFIASIQLFAHRIARL